MTGELSDGTASEFAPCGIPRMVQIAASVHRLCDDSVRFDPSRRGAEYRSFASKAPALADRKE